MKKLIVPLVLGAALLIPGQAVAKNKHYVGAVSPSGSIGFNVVQKKHSKKKSVKGFTFSGVPVGCADGPATTHGDVTFPVKLHQERELQHQRLEQRHGGEPAGQRQPERRHHPRLGQRAARSEWHGQRLRLRRSQLDGPPGLIGTPARRRPGYQPAGGEKARSGGWA